MLEYCAEELTINRHWGSLSMLDVLTLTDVRDVSGTKSGFGFHLLVDQAVGGNFEQDFGDEKGIGFR